MAAGLQRGEYGLYKGFGNRIAENQMGRDTSHGGQGLA